MSRRIWAGVLAAGVLATAMAWGQEPNTTILPVAFSHNPVPPGSPVGITFRFEAKKSFPVDNSVFVHIRAPGGEMAGQLDHSPAVATGSPGWVGQVSYQIRYQIPDSWIDGEYRIEMGLYHQTGGRFVNEKVNAGEGTRAMHPTVVHAGTLIVRKDAPRPPADTERPATLDLTGFKLVFDEDFNEGLSASPWGDPPARWICHTPWSGDYGDARFADPDDLEKGFPFRIVDRVDDAREPAREYQTSGGILRIEMRRNDAWIARDQWKRPWAAGLLASNDPRGNGFKLQYGYFEARMKMPPGPGVWPAFWLASSYDRTRPGGDRDGSVEIDIVEYYGVDPNSYRAAMHVWKPDPHRGQGHGIATRPGEPTAQFNNYGAMVMPDFTTFYFNGIEVWKVPTPPEHNKPLMLIVNLAAGSGWPIDKMISPSYLYVDYVRAWAPATPATPETPVP